MYKLMIGNNFDEKLTDSLIEINQKYTTAKITEVFGSIRSLNYIKTARPDFRLPDIDIEKFKRICLKLYENNIIVNYTINTPIIDHRTIDKDKYENFVRELYDYKVRRLTIAHPLIMKVLGSIDLDIGIELSTIFRISHPRQLYDLKKFNKNLNKVCLDVMRNRDYNYLKEMKRYCDELEIELELIANEFCIYQCAVRDQCYHAHVMNKSVEDTKYFGNWPMGYCITKREKEPIEWLYANFILPQHMNVYYEEFGIDRFKITGRTALTSYVKWVIETYLSQQYNGNLLDLWQDVKNIQRLAQGKQEYLPSHYTIDCKVIDEEFIRWYFKNPVSMETEDQHIKSYFDKAFIAK